MLGIIRRTVLAVWVLLAFMPALGQSASRDSMAARMAKPDSIVVLPDSSNFVTASLIVSAPLNMIYSVFGHVSLRMECPSHALDYVFTLETDDHVGDFMTSVAGKAQARYVAVPTETFIADTREMKRGLMQYKLNLTHHEKQQLWRLLDEQLTDPTEKKFNLQDNCVSNTLLMIQRSLKGENLDWAPWKGEMLLNNGDLVRHYINHSPWAEFLFVTFMGTHYDDRNEQDMRLSPQNVAVALQHASFVNAETGQRRPVIEGKGEELTKNGIKQTSSRWSPMLIFALLLLVTLLITLLEWQFGWRWLAFAYDALLFTTQAIVGALLVYTMLCSELLASVWNWYLVAFLPLPLCLLFRRPSRGIVRCWLIYSCVLVLFILATPFVGALDVPHQLITGSLLVRSVSKTFRTKKQID